MIAKLCEETKMPKFGTKNAIKLLSYLKSAPSNVSICKISQKKQKCLNLGPKMPYLGIFDQKCLTWVFLGMNLKKNYCHIWNQHPQMCLFAKFHKKTKKCLNVGPKVPYLGIFGQEF